MGVVPGFTVTPVIPVFQCEMKKHTEQCELARQLIKEATVKWQ